ncbi:MAG: peptidase T [Burkholderiales bacterium]|nr:peptidase T [Burkholderiales bacterium]
MENDSLDARLLHRFLKYTSFDTQSDSSSSTYPSTAKQLALLNWLVDELKSLGVSDAHLSTSGVVYGHIPASKGYEDCLPIGFLAHVDTSPDAIGKDIRPQIIQYQGGDVVLNKEKGIVFPAEIFKEIDHYVGQDIVFTDGTTLLGADDKAGVAEIMGMVDYLHRNPHTPHAKICIAFTPDEEIAKSIVNFSIEEFGAKYAYTFDGDEIGNLEGENFNAASATLTIYGVQVHPGKAKDKMVNAIRIASEFVSFLPWDQAPETTENKQGFFHPNSIGGTVAKAQLHILIRDHDEENFERRKQFLLGAVKEFQFKHPRAKFELDIQNRYFNMKKVLDKVPKVMELARQAYREAGVEPRDVPIRGGTDGALLAEKGLPTPNIFSGGMNYHGIYEYLPVNSMEKARDIAVNLVKLSAFVKSLA